MSAYLTCNEAQIAIRYHDKELRVNTENFSLRTLLAAYLDLGEVVHRRLECVTIPSITNPSADS